MDAKKQMDEETTMTEVTPMVPEELTPVEPMEEKKGGALAFSELNSAPLKGGNNNSKRRRHNNNSKHNNSKRRGGNNNKSKHNNSKRRGGNNNSKRRGQRGGKWMHNLAQ